MQDRCARGTLFTPLSTRESITTLLREVRACELCSETLPLGPRPVLQCGPRARILIAGQAPGRRVHESGVPFDDPSGDRLREWMAVTRSTFYDPNCFAILPMGFCYPGSSNSGDLPPRPECAPAWRTRLLAQMQRIELTLVLGNYAHRYHFPGDRGSLTQRVANWRQLGPDVMPLPHPSPRNNRWLKQNPWFAAELLPALQIRIQQILGEAEHDG